VGLGDAAGLADAVGLGEAAGLGDAALAALAALADGAAMAPVGAPDDPWLPSRKASGTTIAPRSTVRTKVTAPHSRRKKDRFTDRRF